MTFQGLESKIAFCADVSMDLTHASLAAAVLGPDGKVRVRMVKAWKGPDTTRQMMADLPGLIAQFRPRSFGWFGNGPMVAMKLELEKLRAVEIDSSTTTALCQSFAETVISRRLVHPGDPLLSNHALGAKQWKVGDGWRFVRRGVGHVDALYSAAGAAHLARTLPAPVGVKWL